MKCPITNKECIKKVCGWWDPDNKCCSILSIKEGIESIMLDLEEMKKEIKKNKPKRELFRGFK